MSQSGSFFKSPTPPGGFIETLSGNDSVAIHPDALNNINVVGDGTFITSTGNIATNTITFTITDEIAVDYQGDVGTATAAGGEIQILGGDNINTEASGNAIEINLDKSIHQPETNGTAFGAGSEGWYSLGTDVGDDPIRFMHAYGVNNTFLGSLAGNSTLSTSDAQNNVGLGYQALIGVDEGRENVAIGATNMLSATNSNRNTSVGYAGLALLETGSDNIALGYESGQNYDSTESSNIVIGNTGTVGEDNTIRIGTNGSGTGEQDRNFQAGIAGVTVSSEEMVVINTTTNQLGSQSVPEGFATTYTTDSGDAEPDAAEVLNVLGQTGRNISTSGAGNTVEIAVSGVTEHSAVVGDANGALSSLGVATDGQLIIGSSGADPVLATLLAGGGINVNNGSGSIEIEAEAGSAVLSASNLQFAVSNSGHRYQGFATTGVFPDDTIRYKNTVIPMAGVLSDFYIKNDDSSSNPQMNIRIVVNGNQTDLLIVIPANAPIGTYSNTVDTVPVVAGDEVAVRIDQGSTNWTFESSMSVRYRSTGFASTDNAVEIIGTDSGNVLPDSSGEINILGGDNIEVSGAGNTATVAVSGFNEDRVAIGAANGSLTTLPVMTNGQLIIGNTGNTPSVSTLTAGTGISISNGAGSVTVNATAAGSLTSGLIFIDRQVASADVSLEFTNITATYNNYLLVYEELNCPTAPSAEVFYVQLSTDGGTSYITTNYTVGSSALSGLYLTSDAAQDFRFQSGKFELYNSTSGNGFITSMAFSMSYSSGFTVSNILQQSMYNTMGTTANALRIRNENGRTWSGVVSLYGYSQAEVGTGSDCCLEWTEVTGTSISMDANHGYILNNASLVTATLPTTAIVGQTIKVTIKGTGLGRIAQNAGQQIHYGDMSTTSGTGGYIEATEQFDSVELLCIATDDEFVVLSSTGNWDVN